MPATFFYKSAGYILVILVTKNTRTMFSSELCKFFRTAFYVLIAILSKAYQTGIKVVVIYLILICPNILYHLLYFHNKEKYTFKVKICN